mmetsp:Transcript_47707/g.64736  ORF Transcript_47707/g.64736 Transcript_47707/m.64736 type:complete len:99 (-) Transcript_47707:1286-1582(-)
MQKSILNNKGRLSLLQQAFRPMATNIETNPDQFGKVKDSKKEARFLEQVQMFFNKAADKTGIPKDYLEMIRACDTIIRFTFPIKRDNGEIEMITCYRA